VDVEARDLASLLGGLLRVLEVGGTQVITAIGDLPRQVRLGVALELRSTRALISLGGVLLPSMSGVLPVGADVCLTDRIVRSTLVTACPSSPTGRPAPSPLRASSATEGVVRSLELAMTVGFAAFKDGDDGVGGPEVDADRTSHGVPPGSCLS
jgi:hypothetical protein